MRFVDFRPAAVLDLHSTVAYLAERSPQAAERFGEAVRATAEWLATYPGAGRVADVDASRRDPRRQFAVRGFRSYIVFYRFTKRSLIVVRALHGARDLPGVLGEAEG